MDQFLQQLLTRYILYKVSLYFAKSSSRFAKVRRLFAKVSNNVAKMSLFPTKMLSVLSFKTSLSVRAERINTELGCLTADLLWNGALSRPSADVMACSTLCLGLILLSPLPTRILPLEDDILASQYYLVFVFLILL